ncbi:MFS transporter [Catenulispora yoronensis]|uniref:MFS transporter n=1 Tax=Catenulispora yoronensis TaxID=450799 RepID=A0ABP5FT79_9ACTN
MSLLPESRKFRRFWVARVVSFGGAQVAQVALVVLAAGRGPGAVSFVLLALSVPRLIGPLAGALADLVDTKRIMVVSEVGQACLFGVVAVAPFRVGVDVPLVAVATVLNTVFLPAGRSSIPRMVAPGDLPRAFAAMAMCFNIGYAAGPLVGGALLAVLDPRLVLAVDVAALGGSVVLLLGLRLPAARREEDAVRVGYWATLRAGLTVVIRDPRLRLVSLGLFFTVAFASLSTAALVFVATTTLRGPTWLYGVLMSAYGVGMIAGPAVFLSRWGHAADPLRVWRRGQFMFGAGTTVVGAVPWVGAVLPAQLVAGAGNGVENVATDLLIQESAPARLLGTISSVTIAVPFLANTLAYSAAPPLLHAGGPRVTMLVAGLGVLTVSTLIALLLAAKSPAVEALSS